MKKLALISSDAIPLKLATNHEPLPENVCDKCCKSTSIGSRVAKLAEHLSSNFDVTVFVPDLNYLDSAYLQYHPYKIQPYAFSRNQGEYIDDDLFDSLCKFDCVIVPTSGTTTFTTVSHLPQHITIIVDAWIPLLTEFPAAISYRKDINQCQMWNDFLPVYQQLLSRGDIILCANERQKHFYEGILYYSNKYPGNHLSGSLVHVVPYGVEKHNIVKRTPQSTEKLKLLWYGAFYPWYDPCRLADIVKKNNWIELTFFGAQHPRYKNYFLHLSSVYNFHASNITVVPSYSLEDPELLFSNFDACITLSKPWVENTYSCRVRYTDIVSRGMPLIISKGSSFLEEYSFLKNIVFEVDNNSVEQSLKNILKSKDKLFNVEEITKSVDILYKRYNWDAILTPFSQYLKEIL